LREKRGGKKPCREGGAVRGGDKVALWEHWGNEKRDALDLGIHRKKLVRVGSRR